MNLITLLAQETPSRHRSSTPGLHCPPRNIIPGNRPAVSGPCERLQPDCWPLLSKFLLFIMFLLLSGGRFAPAWGAGFTVYSQGTAAMGQGNAFVAEANDPSAIFYNPAGINQLERPEIYGMALITYPSREYDGPVTSAETHQAFLPSGTFYIVYPINKLISLGFGVFAPFGQESQWPDSWEGRYLSSYGKLTTYNFNPVISFKPHEKFAIALGFDAMMSDVKLRRKVALPFGLPDGDSNLHGKGTGFGFNLGMLLEVVEGFKVGLSYRYQMDVRYKGSLELPQPTRFGLIQASIPATADLTFPHLVTLGVSLSQLQPFVFNFDVTWTGWSSFNAIDVRTSQPVIFNGAPTKSLFQPRDWHDSWTFRFGMNYRLNEQIKLRAGYTYDMSAIPDATFDPQIVNMDQHIFTLGGDYTFDRFTLGLGYNYVLGERRSKNNLIATNGVPAPLQANGSYQSTAHGLGLSLSYRF